MILILSFLVLPFGNLAAPSDLDGLLLVQRGVQVLHGQVVYPDRRPGGDASTGGRATLMGGRTVTDAPDAPASSAPTLPPVIGTGAPHSAAEASGVAGNGPLDGYAFITATIVNSITICICVGIFMVLRARWPKTYENNLKWEGTDYVGCAPIDALGTDQATVEETLHSTWGWWIASMNTTTEQVADTSGLDQAMLLEFCNLGMRMLYWIGMPMCLIIGPMNCAFGGQPAWAIGDYLSSLSFGNVEHGSWLYWVHAFVVWYVVTVVTEQLYIAQGEFLKLRTRWLHKMDDKRANTVLVEGIPEDHRKEGDLQEFFESIFDKENIKSVYAIRNTTQLDPYIHALEHANDELAKKQHEFERAKKEAEEKKKDNQQADEGAVDEASLRPKNWKGDDEITLAEDHVKKAQEDLDNHKKEVRDLRAKGPDDQEGSLLGGTLGGMSALAGDDCKPGDIAWTGFVTFKERKYAQMATSVMYSSDKDTWVVTAPPEPADIIWADLQLSPKMGERYTIFGYLAIGGLYIAYLPIVIGIAQAAVAIDAGPLEAVWIGLAPTLGLQLMVAFLPTILLCIFRSFWVLRANTLAQKKLQSYYFAFQLVFVVMVTAIGSDAVGFTMTVFTDPLALPDLLGETMPPATHFYMNFLVLQWVTHGQAVMRHVQLIKYCGMCALYPEDEALAKSEPEDQDYYGMGSRCARFTINMVIGIVYGTLCPPMNFLCWVNFYCCRLFYGYLIPFAETKKPDLGGVYWVDMLKHLFIAQIIYCIVMCGVLSQRAEMTGFQPVTIAAPSLIYVVYKYSRFERAFSWEELPIPEVSKELKYKKRHLEGDYVQEGMYD